MIVCICHRVSDRTITETARAGCPDFDALMDELRVGTSCGACLDCARSTWDAAGGARPGAPGCGRPGARVVDSQGARA